MGIRKLVIKDIIPSHVVQEGFLRQEGFEIDKKPVKN
jgi:hypothetical protein